MGFTTHYEKGILNLIYWRAFSEEKE